MENHEQLNIHQIFYFTKYICNWTFGLKKLRTTILTDVHGTHSGAEIEEGHDHGTVSVDLNAENSRYNTISDRVDCEIKARLTDSNLWFCIAANRFEFLPENNFCHKIYIMHWKQRLQIPWKEWRRPDLWWFDRDSLNTSIIGGIPSQANIVVFLEFNL